MTMAMVAVEAVVMTITAMEEEAETPITVASLTRPPTLDMVMYSVLV